MSSDWMFNLGTYGSRTITYKDKPVDDVTKVEIICKAGQPIIAKMEVQGIRVVSNLATVETTRKIEVSFSLIENHTGVITSDDLDVIQTLSVKYGFSLGRLVHALAYLKVNLYQDIACLDTYCSRAQEENVEVDFLVHSDGAILKKLEGAWVNS